ncbi:MAG: GtrA family protein [Clostridia bacterium]|nr:GtrA family protein [Clostridia bacterium]
MSSENAQLSKKDNIIQAIKFALFSASAGLIQFLSFTALQELPQLIFGKELPYWACYLPSLILSVLWNFTFNRKFTFKSANNVPVAMLKVALFYAVFTPLSTWLGSLAANAGVNEYIVEIVTMASNLITEFFYDRFFVFKDSINTNDIAMKEKAKAEEKAKENID